jgi:hypothetical protein
VGGEEGGGNRTEVRVKDVSTWDLLKFLATSDKFQELQYFLIASKI